MARRSLRLPENAPGDFFVDETCIDCAQLRSLRRLLAFPFTWVLPGHGGRFRAASPEAMHAELGRLIERLA